MRTSLANSTIDDLQTVTLAGQRFVIIPESEYRRLRSERAESESGPALPGADAQDNYPAIDAMRVVLARDIMQGRRAAGLTQVELARRAGLRPETLNRIEKGKHTPSVATIEKIDRALAKVRTAVPARK
jgi:DNA-binding XRE family transcriptional regulator